MGHPQQLHHFSRVHLNLASVNGFSVSFLPSFPLDMKNDFSASSQEPRVQGACLYFSFQVVVKKVSKQHRWYLENTSGDRESCWKEKILLSARGFSVFFQMLVKAQKVRENLCLLGL